MSTAAATKKQVAALVSVQKQLSGLFGSRSRFRPRQQIYQFEVRLFFQHQRPQIGIFGDAFEDAFMVAAQIFLFGRHFGPKKKKTGRTIRRALTKLFYVPRSYKGGWSVDGGGGGCLGSVNKSLPFRTGTSGHQLGFISCDMPSSDVVCFVHKSLGLVFDFFFRLSKRVLIV